jgi:hypothetical protein
VTLVDLCDPGLDPEARIDLPPSNVEDAGRLAAHERFVCALFLAAGGYGAGRVRRQLDGCGSGQPRRRQIAA